MTGPSPRYRRRRLGLASGVLVACLAVGIAQARPGYRYDGKWGSGGSGNGQFNEPGGIAVDSSGRVHVADNNNSRVQLFTSAGVYLRQWAAPSAFGLAIVPGGDIYVSSVIDNLVGIYHPNGSLVDTFGAAGSGNGQFNIPLGVAVDAGRSVVYVCDRLNHRVQKFDLAGGYLAAIGGPGTGDGQLADPYGVAVDAAGTVYVADTTNSRVQAFSSLGAFQNKWGVGGSGDGQFTYPYGVHVDAAGYVYVADTFNHRIQKFSAAGAFVTKFGTTGTGDGQLRYPRAVTTYRNKVYVSDTDNDRIQCFRPNATPTAPTTVKISPASPTDTQTLSASAQGSTDADGDALTYRYAWYSSPNGTTWSAGPTTRTVSASLTSVGQSWRVKARAYDGDAYSGWKLSANVTVGAASASGLVASAAAAGNASGGAQITVQLSGPANVTVSIANLAGRTVAVLPGSDLDAGVSTLLWDGKSSAGTRVPPGQYTVVVTVRGASGQTSRVVTPLRR